MYTIILTIKSTTISVTAIPGFATRFLAESAIESWKTSLAILASGSVFAAGVAVKVSE